MKKLLSLLVIFLLVATTPSIVLAQEGDTAPPPEEEMMPSECLEVGITDPGECSKYIFDIMEEKRGPAPEGEMKPPEGEIIMPPPPEFERPEDRPMFVPQKMMMPPECVEAGATTKEECEKIMMTKFGPPKGMPMPKPKPGEAPTIEAEGGYPVEEACPPPHVGYKPEPYPGIAKRCRYMTDGCALEFETNEECMASIEVEEIEIDPGFMPGNPLYVADKLKNNVELMIARGEKKAELALKIKKERLNEAEILIEENLEAADEKVVEKYIEGIVKDMGKKDKVIEREASPEVGILAEEESQKSIETLVELKYKLPEEGWEGVENALEQQIAKEKKLKLAAEITRKIDALCEELAELDYDLMLAEPRCNPDKTPKWMKERQKELKIKDDEAVKMMLRMMQQCMNDPRECDCSGIPIQDARAECEEGRALAIRCEFKQEMEACDELDKMDTKMIQTIPAPLRPFFKQKFMALKEKKEKEMMKKFAPPECIEAGATTRQECEAIMMAKYAPPECIAAGATTKEACEEIMTPPECKEKGIYDRYECEKIMMSIYGAPPEECVDAEGHFIGERECNTIMMPPECIEAGATTPEECMMLMTPPECKVAGAFDRESCEQIMIKINVPPECIVDGKPVSPEECEAIMMRMHAPPECRRPDGSFVSERECGAIMGEMLPEECKKRGLSGEECKILMMIPRECKEAGITDKASCERFMERIYEEKIILEEPDIVIMPKIPQFEEYEDKLPPAQIIEEYGIEEGMMPGMEVMTVGYGGGEMVSDEEVNKMLYESEAVQAGIEHDLHIVKGVYGVPIEERPSEEAPIEVEAPVQIVPIQEMHEEIAKIEEAKGIIVEETPPVVEESKPVLVEESVPEPAPPEPALEPTATEGGGGGEITGEAIREKETASSSSNPFIGILKILGYRTKE